MSDIYEDAQNAATDMMGAVLGYANLIEGRDGLDAKEVAEVVGMLRSAARALDTLSNVIAIKTKREP